MTLDRKALLDQLAATPEAPEPYLVYADALTEAGDPQGELIALMQSNRTGAADAHLVTHRKHLFGALADHRGIEWHLERGFVRSAHYIVQHLEDARQVIEQLVALPIAHLIREIVVFEPFADQARFDRIATLQPVPLLHAIVAAPQFTDLDAALAAKHVRWAQLDHFGDELPAALWGLGELEYLTVWSTDLERLSAQVGQLTRLRRLELHRCARLTSLPDELIGNPSLRHLWLDDCAGLKSSHPTRQLDALLDGFANTGASPRRRIVEYHLFLGHAGTATVEELRVASTSNVAAVRTLARRTLKARTP